MHASLKALNNGHFLRSQSGVIGTIDKAKIEAMGDYLQRRHPARHRRRRFKQRPITRIISAMRIWGREKPISSLRGDSPSATRGLRSTRDDPQVAGGQRGKKIATYDLRRREPGHGQVLKQKESTIATIEAIGMRKTELPAGTNMLPSADRASTQVGSVFKSSFHVDRAD